MSTSFSATSPALLYFFSPSSFVDLGERLLAKARKRPSLPLIAAASRQHIEDTVNELRQAGVPRNEALKKLLSLWGAVGNGDVEAGDAEAGDAEAGDAEAGDAEAGDAEGSAGSGRSFGSGRVAALAVGLPAA